MTANRRLMERLEQVKQEQSEGGEDRRDFATRVAEGRRVGTPDESSPGLSLSYVDVSGDIAIVNTTSSPVEFLVSNGEMELGEDEDGMAGVRFHTAIRLRDLVAGAQVKGLKSANLEPSASGGGFGPVDVLGYQVDCRRILIDLRAAFAEDWIYPMLEAVVVGDEWLDLWPLPAHLDRRGVKRKQRLKTLVALHYGLDKTGQVLGYMHSEGLMRRWPLGAPAMPPSVLRRIRATKAVSPLAPRS